MSCIDCKNFKREQRNWINDRVIHPQTCLSGHTEKMKQWWVDNGEKIRPNFDVLDCFEDTDSAKMLALESKLVVLI